MARSKIKRVAILDERARKSTLKKRTESLFKKVRELSILCDVEVVAIIQDPNDNGETVWPSKEAVAEKIARFSSLSDMEKSKKMTTHISFLAETVKNNYEKCKRLAIKNDEREMEYLFIDYISGSVRDQDLDVMQTKGLITFLKNVAKSLQTRNQELENSEQQRHQELQQLQQRQLSAYLVSHSNYYIPFLPQQQQRELPFTKSSAAATYPHHYSQQELPSIRSSRGAASHSHHSLQHRQAEQLPRSNTTSSYLASTLNPETMSIIACENCFMEIMFHNQNIMDLCRHHHAAAVFPQSAIAFGKGSNMGFNQTATVNNVAENYAFPAPPNANTNHSDGAKNN